MHLPSDQFSKNVDIVNGKKIKESSRGYTSVGFVRQSHSVLLGMGDAWRSVYIMRGRKEESARAEEDFSLFC